LEKVLAKRMRTHSSLSVVLYSVCYIDTAYMWALGRSVGGC